MSVHAAIGGPERSPIETPEDEGELLHVLISRPEWKRPAGMMRVGFRDPTTTGHLLRMLFQTGRFGMLVYNSYHEHWMCQFRTSISGPYPSGATPQIAMAKALIMIWIEEAGK